MVETPQSLIEWLSQNLPKPWATMASSASLEPCHGGHSNLTYLLRLGDQVLVLRRAPPGVKAKTAHDMVREASVLRAIQPHFSLAPEVYAVCDDPEVMGTRFFIMQHLRGPICGRRLPMELSAEQCRVLMHRVMDLHADLHAVDLQATGLGRLGKPQGYVSRQVQGWSRRYRAARTDDVPSCEALMKWLDDHQPSESGAALIHNDFKLDNLVLDPLDPTQIIGVLDWEMTTVGDPLLDLGASMAYWVETDDPAPMQALRTLPSTEPGMPTREELIARYCARSQIQVDDFRWYLVYGLFRLAVIAQQIYLRFTLGQSRNPRFAKLGSAVHALRDQAREISDI